MLRFLVLAAIAATDFGCSDKGSPPPSPTEAPRGAAGTRAPFGTDHPTMEQCEHALARIVDLELAANPNADREARDSLRASIRARFFDACRKGTRAMVECIIDGADMDALGRCDEKP
jgi:hypothetical protein